MTQPLPFVLRVRIPFLPIIITGLATLVSPRVDAQIIGEWTWESGANFGGATAVYGTQGVAAAANVPGNRDSQSGWADASGNFWLFGGDDVTAATYNDLWKYNPTTGLWAWVSGNNTGNASGSYGTKGTASATNLPPSRFGQNVTVDPAGNFWMFGGATVATFGTSTMLNDLWKYNPTTNRWTWVSGDNTTGSSGVYGTKGTAAAANKPGGRIYPSVWSDAAGNIWVYGGLGFDGVGTNASLNDLWEYNVTTGRWTWISGSTTANAAGVYGTKGVAAAANVPGARNSSAGWRDAAGNFYVFGGSNGAFFSGGASYNDLWKYTVATGRWTWLTGLNTNAAVNTSGTKGVSAPGNTPGARYGHSVAVDAAGNFWLFGGYYGNTGSAYNDLWMYNISLGEWNWVSGNSGFNTAAVYGTKGVMASSVTPSARGYQSMWTDAANNVWVSSGYDGANDNNDLFKFSIVTILAVEQLSLQGVHEAGANGLSWNTYGENNAASFAVERGVDGSHFAPIGEVPAVGHGDNSYSFSDTRLPAGKLFYRIRAASMDSSAQYSAIIALGGSSTGVLSVYPNPARTSITLQPGDNSLMGTPVWLLDMNGRVIGESIITGTQQTINVSRLTPGTYMLQLSNGTSIKMLKTP